MIFAGILAGGAGSRMETATMPKQFLRVCGEPIFIRTLKKFLSIPKIDKIIVSTNPDWESKYVELMDEFCIDKEKVILVKGGETRFLSLVNVSKKAKELDPTSDAIIITHDCARMFVSERIINDNLELINKYDMITTSIPVIDTILQSDDGASCSVVPDRSKLWADQGPQTYRVEKFLRYVSMIPKNDISSYIEAGKVYLSHNGKIGIVMGERFNFKVTNDIDLQYAEFLLKGGFIK